MKSEKNHIVLGSLFLIASGLIFTLERLIGYVYWFAQIVTGEYPTEPKIDLFSNFFVYIFFIIGVIFFVIYFKYREKLT